MQDLIVLGLLPGTNIQITFLFWLGGVLAGLFCITIWVLRRIHLVRNWLVSILLYIKTHRHLQA